MKILILCTGNSCRSQMAEGFIKTFRPEWNVFSAGTLPAASVSRRTIRAMQAIGIDISQNMPKSVGPFLTQSFDCVLTVCDHANETCPVFTGEVKKRIHIGFPDPTKINGEPEEVFQYFIQVRDDMEKRLKILIAAIEMQEKTILHGLRQSWSLHSSSRWTAENPARGQCAVTALVMNDHFGGEILKTRLPDGQWHFYNRILDERFDFTASQFPAAIQYGDIGSNRDEVFASTTEVQYHSLAVAFAKVKETLTQ